MTGREKQFFTTGEAISAIRIAFEQYQSQLNPLAVIWPLVFGNRAYILSDSRNRTIWAKLPGRAKLLPSNEADLKLRIVDQLKRSPPDPEQLAGICAQVFGVHVEPGPGPRPDSPPGLWVDTDMADFVCLQCGHCCRTLNYRDGCSVADYHRWQTSGRIDILEWVGTVRRNGEVVACRIWMEPGTNRYAESCPWLSRVDPSGRRLCTIHDARPAVCRYYPGTRKHARLTGCRGV